MGEIYEDEDKIAAIKNWAEDDKNHWFDTTFVEAMEDALEQYGELTERQADALDSIIDKNKIDVGAWKDA
jgi:hypothetical protein